MDNKTIFIRTKKGEEEVQGKTGNLPGELKRALRMVDGEATFIEISKRAAPSLRANLKQLFKDLEKDGFILEKSLGQPGGDHIPKMSVPIKTSSPSKNKSDDEALELDFMAGFTQSQQDSKSSKTKQSVAATGKLTNQEIEFANIKSRQQAEDLELKKEMEVEKLREEEVRQANEVADAAKLSSEQDSRRKQDIEENERKKKAEAEQVKLEQEAARKAIEMALAKAKKEQEDREKEEKLRESIRAREEERSKKEQEEIRAREEKEQEAARVRSEVKRIRKEQEEARAREEAERIQKEQEAARVRAEVERIRKEQEDAKVRAEVERIRKEQEEARAREEAERIQKEQEAAKVRAEVERIRKEQEEAKVRAEVERIRKEQEEARIRVEAERIRKEQEEAKVRAEVERIRKEQEEARIRVEAERIRKEQEEARAREEAERIKKEQEEARIRAEAERIRKEQEEAKAREEAERIRKEQEEVRIRTEAERIIRLEQEDARVREQAERILKEESKAAQAHKKVVEDQPEIQSSEKISDSSDSFSFDTFQVENPLYTSEYSKENKSGKIVTQKAGKVEPVVPSTVVQSGSVPFDSFKIDANLSQSDGQNGILSEKNTNQVDTPDASLHEQEAKDKHLKNQQAELPILNNRVDDKPNKEIKNRSMKGRAEAKKAIAKKTLQVGNNQTGSKGRVEAEQRANEVTGVEVEQIPKQISLSVADITDSKPTPYSNEIRKDNFSWGKFSGIIAKLSLFLLVIVIVALFIIPSVVPMRDYMPKAEQIISEHLHQPVHIGRLSGRILPSPRLELGEIYIGDAKQFQADVAQVNFSFMDLFSDKKPISNLDFEGVKIRGSGLKNSADWLQKMAKLENYPVSHISIENGTFDNDVFQITGIEGVLNFDSEGRFSHADLQSNAGKYTLAMKALPENTTHIDFTLHDSSLPLFPNWKFDSLYAKGELRKNDLLISDYDAKISGGEVYGTASLNWHSGWNAQGTLNAKTINMQMLNKLLNGNVDGTARFRMSSENLGGFAGSTVVDGIFSSKDGLINGLEITETARKQSVENLPGGRTHYDTLTGNFSFSKDVYHFKQTKIISSTLSSIADFDFDTSRQLMGKMNVSLSIHGQTPAVELQMGGTIDSPTLRYIQ